MSGIATNFIQKRGEMQSGQIESATENLYKQWEMEAQKELAEANLEAAKAQSGKK